MCPKEDENEENERQNHRTRMVKTGKDHWKSSSPTPLLQQSSLEQVTQDCVQTDFECLQRRMLLNLSGLPVPAVSHPYENFFLMFR